MTAVVCHLIMCLAFAFQSATPHKSDREQHGYKGPVQSVDIEYEETFSASDGQLKSAITSSTVEFDRAGNWIAYTYRWSDGTVQKDLLDPQKHLNTSVTVDAKGVVLGRTDTSLDEQNRVIQLTIRKGDGQIILTYTNTYDPQGRIAQSVVTNPDGSLHSKSVSAYDPARNSQAIVSYDSQGIAGSKMVSLYDELGNIIGNEVYDDQGRLNYKHSRTKDDSNTIDIYENYASDGALASRQVCVTDQADREISNIIYNPDGSVKEELRSDYRGDSRGNYTEVVTSRLTWKDGTTSSEPIRTIRRKITYY
jgi:hypothetical protein